MFRLLKNNAKIILPLIVVVVLVGLRFVLPEAPPPSEAQTTVTTATAGAPSETPEPGTIGGTPAPTPTPTPVAERAASGPEEPGEGEPFPILPTILVFGLAIGGWEVAKRIIGKPRWVNPPTFPTVDKDRAGITVNYFIEWKVTNILLYTIAQLGGKMNDRLVAFANGACPSIFPQHTFDDQQGMIEDLEAQVTQRVLERARGLGVEAKVHIEGISLSEAAQAQRDIASAEKRAGEGDKEYFEGLGFDESQITPALVQEKIKAEAQVEAYAALGRGIGQGISLVLAGLRGETSQPTEGWEGEESHE